MTIPRTRRYPRQPIRTAAERQSAEDNERYAAWQLTDPTHSKGFFVIKRSAWTTNLTLTSPPLPPERRSKLRNGPEGTETAPKQNNGVYARRGRTRPPK